MHKTNSLKRAKSNTIKDTASNFSAFSKNYIARVLLSASCIWGHLSNSSTKQLVKPWTSQQAPLIFYNIVAWFSAQHGEQTSKASVFLSIESCMVSMLLGNSVINATQTVSSLVATWWRLSIQVKTGHLVPRHTSSDVGTGADISTSPADKICNADKVQV